jgi:hypothetical protein
LQVILAVLVVVAEQGKQTLWGELGYVFLVFPLACMATG